MLPTSQGALETSVSTWRLQFIWYTYCILVARLVPFWKSYGWIKGAFWGIRNSWTNPSTMVIILCPHTYPSNDWSQNDDFSCAPHSRDTREQWGRRAQLTQQSPAPRGWPAFGSGQLSRLMAKTIQDHWKGKVPTWVTNIMVIYTSKWFFRVWKLW